jgi:hypothetical protein
MSWLGVTAHPTAEWIARQLTEACGWDPAPRYIVRDWDRVYGVVFTRRLRAMGIRDRPTAPRSPWQNGHTERLIGSIRRECLDHVIVFGGRHLRHVLLSYMQYYNGARTHLSLNKDAPVPRAANSWRITPPICSDLISDRDRFRKGSSPNPGGRPAASPAPRPSEFEVLLEETLTVTDRTGTREMTLEETLQMQTYQRALAGDRMDVREVIKWIMKRAAWLTKHASASRPPPTSYTSPDPDNVDAALLLVGIAAPNPARAEFSSDRAQLLLEPRWVQAALHRRRGGERLTDKERDEIRRCTRDPDTLRWPRGYHE